MNVNDKIILIIMLKMCDKNKKQLNKQQTSTISICI